MNRGNPKAIVSDDAIKFEKDHWSSTGSFRRRPEPGWTHNSQDLTGGFGVAYSVMFCGLIGIKKSLSSMNETKRTNIIRESIMRVLHISGVRSMGKKLKKPPKQIAEFIEDGADVSLAFSHVNLIINSEKFLTSYENGKKMLCHTLNDVSFVATGIGATADYIGYVSRDKTIPRACFVFDCLGNSQHIANTMTQAFEIKLKEMLSKNTCNDLTASQGMHNGGWADEHLYAEGAGCWRNESLPPVPAVFDDNIYEGLKNTSDPSDPLYDNNTKGADRGDAGIYDNRPEATSIGYSEKGIYDNSTCNSGRNDCEAEYDNHPKMEAEDYLEGLLKQNIYDNNVRAKVPSRMPEENPYDNKDQRTSLDCDISAHGYTNLKENPDSVMENLYECGDPLYDNNTGGGSGRNISEGIYDNKTGVTEEVKSPPVPTSCAETEPALYDNSPNNPTNVQIEDTYTSMNSINRSDAIGIYDNVCGEDKPLLIEEALYDEVREVKCDVATDKKYDEANQETYDVVNDATYDVANDVKCDVVIEETYDVVNEEKLDVANDVNYPTSSDYVIHRVDTVIVDSMNYDKLTNLYDLPFNSQNDNTEETLQIYDNALPNEQAVKPPTTDLATELTYDNNMLIDPKGIERLIEDDEFEANPVYGVPEESLSPINQLSNHAAGMMFDGKLAEPKKLPASGGFAEGAIYGEGLVTSVKPDPESTRKILPINSLPFFHRLLSRKDCEALLVNGGDFLVRESQSKKGQYVISGLHLGKYQHMLFLAKEGKILTKDREFPSIPHLVAHYMKTKELLTTGSNTLSLLHPIIASFPDSDIYTMMQ